MTLVRLRPCLAPPCRIFFGQSTFQWKICSTGKTNWPNMFLAKNAFGRRIFLGKKLAGTKLGRKIFCPKNFGPTFFRWKRFSPKNCFSRKQIRRKSFWSKKFSAQKCFGQEKVTDKNFFDDMFSMSSRASK